MKNRDKYDTVEGQSEALEKWCETKQCHETGPHDSCKLCALKWLDSDDGVGANDSKDRFVFAKESKEDFAPLELDLEELYKKSLNTRDGMRELLQNAMDSALENLMSWERVARANGFGIVCFSDTGMGRPVPHFEDGKLSFVQRYGVLVKDLKVEGKGNKDK